MGQLFTVCRWEKEEDASNFVLMQLLHAWLQTQKEKEIGTSLFGFLVRNQNCYVRHRGLGAEMRSHVGGAKINWTKTKAALRALPSLAQSPLSSLPPSLTHSVDRWQISVSVPPFLFQTGARWVRSLSHFPPPCRLFSSPRPSPTSPFCLFL